MTAFTAFIARTDSKMGTYVASVHVSIVQQQQLSVKIGNTVGRGVARSGNWQSSWEGATNSLWYSAIWRLYERASPHCIKGLLLGRFLPIFTGFYRFFGLSCKCITKCVIH